MKCHAYSPNALFTLLDKAHKYQADNPNWHYSFIFKMHRISFIQLLILFIAVIGIANSAGGKRNIMRGIKNLIVGEKNKDHNDKSSDQFQFEVIEDDTTEEEDMKKAIQIGKTFFWRNMLAIWKCEMNILYNKPQEIRKNSIELKKFSENWKMKALAADAFIKSLECKEKDELKCLCVKPRFLVEQGELQLSSAMEAIKGVYRDLFRWGNGEGLKIEIKFENEKAWDFVDRWLKAFKGNRILQRDEVNKMLTEAENNKILLKTENTLKIDPYFDKFENSEFSQHFSTAPPRLKSAHDSNNGVKAFDSEMFYYDKEKKRDYLGEFKSAMEEYKKKANLLEDENLNDHQKFEVLKQLKQESVKLWDISLQIGLAGTKIMEIIGNESNKKGQQKAIKQIKNIYKEEKGNKQIEIGFEKIVGILFMSINVMIGDLMKKIENGDELKQLLLQNNPCEEAKLKLKKMEMADESNSEVIKKDKGNAKSKGKEKITK